SCDTCTPRSCEACVYDTPRSLIRRTASSLNSRVNFRRSMTHLRSHCHTKLGVFGTGCRPNQVFDVRPISRRYLSLEKIGDPAALEVAHGQIVVTRSGNVGRSTLVHSVHEHHIVSDDLLRIAPKGLSSLGWLYSYLRAPRIREVMKAVQYGHIIKHLEVQHLRALPVVEFEQ